MKILLLVVVLVFTLALIIASFLSEGTFAFKLGSYVWFTLFLFLLVQIYDSDQVKNIRSNAQNAVRRVVNWWSGFSYKRHAIVAFVLLVLLISGLQDKYYLGGDDTRLYFLYPKKYYQNFVSNIGSDTSLSGYKSFLYTNSISYFLFLMMVLNKLVGFLNLQSLMYSANILGGLYFFYRLFVFTAGNEKSNKTIAVVASLMYVLSIFNFYILYNSKLMSIFVLTIFPLSIYMFIRAVDENRLYLILFLSLILTVFTITSISSFWFAASLMTSLPLILYQVWDKRHRAFKFLLILLICLFALNINWIYFVQYGTLFSRATSDLANSIVSEDFLSTNIEGIRLTAEKNKVFYPLFNSFHHKIQTDFNWPYLPIFTNWYLKILPLNGIFFLILLSAGILSRSSDKHKRLYLFSSLAFVLAVYFFTVDIGELRFGNPGIALFGLFTRYLPGFIVFRNMYDKFAHAIAFNYAYVLGVGLMIIITKFENYRKAILTSVLVVILVNAKPYIFNEFDNTPIWTTRNYHSRLEEFDSDYLAMTEYIKEQEFNGKYMQFPLNRGNSAIIRSKNDPNELYVGVSPLMIFTGKNDLSGTLSFGPYSKTLELAILEQDFDLAKQIIRKMNPGYVIVNERIPDELKNSYLFAEDFYYKQLQKDFIDAVLGEKLTQFGDSYSLYLPGRELRASTVYLTKNPDEFPQEFETKYKKLDNYLFEIEIDSPSESNYLVFLEPYSRGWTLLDHDKQPLSDIGHTIALGYANAWEMPDNTVINAEDFEKNRFYIYFKPYDNYKTLLGLSLFSFVLISGCAIYLYRTELKK